MEQIGMGFDALQKDKETLTRVSENAKDQRQVFTLMYKLARNHNRKNRKEILEHVIKLTEYLK